MFQPQPTPFASCFAPSPFLFPAAPNTTAAPGASTSRSYSSTTTSAVSNPSPISISDPSFDLPPQPSLSPYGLAPSETPFGFYFPPADPSGRVGAGARIGGAGGAGATSQQGSSRGRPAAVAQAAPPTTASTRLRSGATAVAASPNPSARGLICGSSLAASSQLTSSANLSGRHQQQQQQQQQQQHRRSRHRHNPAASRMEDQDPHGMAAQQAAAKDYQPDLPNYLVGNKAPSDAITEEYAKADQTYVEKTIALPQRYSHYRPVRGDGNCGWRAIGFSYFEKLVDTGDRTQIENEANRLLGMNPMLGEVGGYDYYEDWAEEFVDFLREIANNIDNRAVAHELVHQKWNDEAATSGMIYYLRLLAATYLKANPETYDPFIADTGGVQGYCSQSIELINREIEHLGIEALVNVLLKPVNFVVEIAYLDRSPGSQVNTYRVPAEANNQDDSTLGAIIYLLYRPEHYDILYRPPPEAPSQPVSIQVHRVSSFTDNAGISSTQNDLGSFSTVDYGTLAMIPGFGGAGMPMSPPGGPSTSEAFQTSQQGQTPWAPQFGLAAPSPQPSTPQPPVVAAGPAPNPPLSPHASIGPRQPPPMMPGAPLAPSPECSIRFSPMQLEYDGGKSNYLEPPFQVRTNTFKNSVWNRAHFGNPDFHPEEWCPEDESADGRMGSRRRGSRKEV